MTLDSKTKTWLELAENHMEFAGQILQNKQRPYFACNECHQAIEKLLKALIQQKTGKNPPRTHNLAMLAEETGIELPENRGKFLLKLNPHYMGTRYPDDLLQFYKQYTLEYAAALHRETQEIFQWLNDHLTPKK